MTRPDWPTGLALNFGGLDLEHSSLERSRAVVLPVPYDFSTSYQGGTRWGPEAILAASRNMELWDEELGATYTAGIHTMPALEPTALGPEAMAARVERAVGWIVDQDKLPAVLGGSTASPPAACARSPRAGRGSRCSSSTPTPTCATSTSTRRTATRA